MHESHGEVANGVKQGAVMSPVLFFAYIDDLLLLLKKQFSVATLVPTLLVPLSMPMTLSLLRPLLLLFVKC